MKTASTSLLIVLVFGCGGDPFVSAELEAGPELVDVLEHDQGAELDVLEHDAGDRSMLEDAAASASDSASRLPPDAAEALDAGGAFDASLPCDPSYGDASPGGPCCVHVWATPTQGAVLCTVDGSRWCWQTGMPCSPDGSRCVVQAGVQYCAP